MVPDPESAEEAMILVLAWIAAASEVKFTPDDTCLKTFRDENMAGFTYYFNQGYWKKAASNLKIAATLHGAYTSALVREKDPNATAVDMASFFDAGLFVREHCTLTVSAVLRADDQPPAGIRGIWCSWPT